MPLCLVPAAQDVWGEFRDAGTGDTSAPHLPVGEAGEGGRACGRGWSHRPRVRRPEPRSPPVLGMLGRQPAGRAAPLRAAGCRQRPAHPQRRRSAMCLLPDYYHRQPMAHQPNAAARPVSACCLPLVEVPHWVAPLQGRAHLQGTLPSQGPCSSVRRLPYTGWACVHLPALGASLSNTFVVCWAGLRAQPWCGQQPEERGAPNAHRPSPEASESNAQMLGGERIEGARGAKL